MARRLVEAKIQEGKDIFGQKPVDTFSTVKLWKDVKAQEQRQGVYSLQFNFEGDQLCVGYGNGAVDLIDAYTGKLVQNLRPARYGGFQVMCLRFCPGDIRTMYISTSEGEIITCNIDSAVNQTIITEENNEINCFDFCCDGYQFATAGKDLGVRVYDTKSSKLIRNWEGTSMLSSVVTSKRNSMRVFALKYHPLLEDMFVTGGWDNQLKIWDMRTQDGVQRTISGPHICGDGIDMKEHEILTGSWVGVNALQWWGYREGNRIANIKFPHCDEGEFLYCAQICDNNMVLAGGSGTNSVEAIDRVTGEHLGGLKMKKPVQALDSTFGGRLFAFGGQDKTVKICLMT